MLRFTIRDVLWLTVVVALAVGWWLERRQLHADVTSLRVEVEEARAWKKSDLDTIYQQFETRIRELPERGVRRRPGSLVKTVSPDPHGAGLLKSPVEEIRFIDASKATSADTKAAANVR